VALSLSDALSNEELKRLVERTKKLVRINLQDLPLAELKRWLELQWSDAASDLLLPASITRQMLAGDAQSSVTITWPGGGTFSDSMVVTHGLGSAPMVVVATPNDINLSLGVTAITATTFTVQARDVNGTVHGLGPFGVARWIARL